MDQKIYKGASMNNQLTLKEICAKYEHITDKNSNHSYVDEIYGSLFNNIRNSAKKVLEIGVEHGGSILMWRDYFKLANITAIDIKTCPRLANEDRIQFIVADGYNHDFAQNLKETFDVIIDDGPHTIESMIFVAKEYAKKLNENGILIIEDIPDLDWTNTIKSALPSGFKSEVRDLRNVRGRYRWDDIAMIVRRI